MLFIAPKILVAALLAQLVYHSGADVVVPPEGWEKVDAYYDRNTGYYGEAWAERAESGDREAVYDPYQTVIQVSRGTPFPALGPRAPRNVPALTTSSGRLLAPVPLADEAQANLYGAVHANVAILFGSRPRFINAADHLYTQIRLRFGSAIPVIETGSSLGGAIADGIVAAHMGDKRLSALTFNALAYGNATAGVLSKDCKALPIFNYYVGNEILTRNVVVGTIQWVTSGQQLGQLQMLEPIQHFHDPTATIIDRIIEAHAAAAATSQVFAALYDEPVSPLYTHPTSALSEAAMDWLRDRFPAPASTHRHILRVINAPMR